MYKLLKIDQINTSPFHSQTNGLTLSEYIHYVDKNLNDWDQFSQYKIFVNNSTEHSLQNTYICFYMERTYPLI